MKVQTEIERYDGSKVLVEHDDCEVAREYITRQAAWVTKARKLVDRGVPALERLMKIAEANRSGQATYISKFLLGLYNGQRFPFSLTDLRGLDADIMDDCLAVLEMDIKACQREVHNYFDDGGVRFEDMAKRYEKED